MIKALQTYRGRYFKWRLFFAFVTLVDTYNVVWIVAGSAATTQTILYHLI